MLTTRQTTRAAPALEATANDKETTPPM